MNNAERNPIKGEFVRDLTVDDSKEVNLLELFYSIDGETKRSGELVWFIRLSKCNLACFFCDTAYSQKQEGENISIADLINRLKVNNCKKVTLTGGEPLIHKNVKDLVWALCEQGYDVNIETNGSVYPEPVLYFKELMQAQLPGSVWFSMDYKSKYSRMQNKMISVGDMCHSLGDMDCVKFVVANEEDLEDAYNRIVSMEEYYDSMSNPYRPTYYISPCFGEIELARIVEFMKEKELVTRVKFQIQIHKIIWDPMARLC